MSSKVLQAFSYDYEEFLGRIRRELRSTLYKTAKRQTIQALLEVEEANRELFDDTIEHDSAKDAELVEAIKRSAQVGKDIMQARAQIDATARCTIDMVVAENGKGFEAGEDGQSAAEIVTASMRAAGAMVSYELEQKTTSRVVDMLDKEAKRSVRLLEQQAKMRDDGGGAGGDDEDSDEDDDDDEELEGQAVGGGPGKGLECCITKARFVEPVFSSVCGHQFSKQAVMRLFAKSSSVQCPVTGCKKTFTKRELFDDDIMQARLEADEAMARKAGGAAGGRAGGKASKASKRSR